MPTIRLGESEMEAPPQEYVSSVDVVGTLLVLARKRRFLLIFTLVAALVTTVIVFLLPNVYTASARLMPPQQSQSLSTLMLGQLGPLSGLASAGRDLGFKNPSDLYVTMLQSETLSRNLIDKFDLKGVYGKKTYADAKEKLKENAKFSVGKEGVITIEVDDHSPQRAADMANTYVVELQKLTQKLSSDEAAQRKAFFEQQLEMARQELSEAELQLKSTQEKTGVLELSSQARLILESVARIRAQIAAKQVQLRALQSFATGQNPDLVRTQQELAGLRSELGKLESQQSAIKGDGVESSAGRVPESGLAYIRGLREVKYYELVFELIAKQFEAAKLDEARTAVSIQAMDLATPPEKKTRPARLLTIILVAVSAFLLGAIYILLEERLSSSAETQNRWRLLWATVRSPF